MDGCPRREDPSFPGWIIILWLKFAFSCTALSVIPCCVDKSPAGSPTAVLSLPSNHVLVLVPTAHPFLSIPAHLVHIQSWPAGGAVDTVHWESSLELGLCPQGTCFLEAGHQGLVHFVLV